MTDSTIDLDWLNSNLAVLSEKSQSFYTTPHYMASRGDFQIIANLHQSLQKLLHLDSLVSIESGGMGGFDFTNERDPAIKIGRGILWLPANSDNNKLAFDDLISRITASESADHKLQADRLRNFIEALRSWPCFNRSSQSLAQVTQKTTIENKLQSLSQIANAEAQNLNTTMSQIAANNSLVEDRAASATTLRLKTKLKFDDLKYPLKFGQKLALATEEVEHCVSNNSLDLSHFEKSGYYEDIVANGEIYLICDGYGRHFDQALRPSHLISTAGFNIAYEQQKVIELNFENRVQKLSLATAVEKNPEIRDHATYFEYMQRKWLQILNCALDHSSTIVVLPAIGLGAFLPYGPSGSRDRYIKASAKALELAANKCFTKFESIIFCHPFSDSDIMRTFEKYARSFEVLAEDLFALLAKLNSNNSKVSTLNPSDIEALVTGNIGQFWYTKQMALEEAFVYQTTCLLNNWFFTGHLPENHYDFVQLLHGSF